MFWVPNGVNVIIGWIALCIIMGGYVWFEKFRHPEESYDCWLIKGLRAVAFIFFAVFSLLFIDTNINILFFGIIGYGNLALHLASIILTFLLAFELLFGVLFVAPNRKGLLTFAGVLGYFIYYWEVYLNQAKLEEINLFGSKYSGFMAGIFFPALVGIAIASILTLMEYIYGRLNSDRSVEDKPFWNIQVKAKTIFSMKFNLLLWILFSAELILNLQGISLLYWVAYLL